jgi:DNA-binding MarR family transcriptional regulator
MRTSVKPLREREYYVMFWSRAWSARRAPDHAAVRWFIAFSALNRCNLRRRCRTQPKAGRSMANDIRVDDEAAQASAGNAREGVLLRLEEFLPYRLTVLASLVSQALSRVYSEPYGIGVAEWRVLAALGQYGVMTGKAIGAHGHMHKTKVSRAVALLEHRKLVARRANRSDMREAFLSLTPAGRDIYEHLAPIMLAMAEQLIAAVEPADRAVFDRVLKALTDRSAGLATEAAPTRDPSRAPADG